MRPQRPNNPPLLLKRCRSLRPPILQQTIPLPAPQRLPTAAPTANGGTANTDSTTGEKTYTVKSGDMLITIAKAQGTTVKALRAANSLTSDNIKVGQKLKIPNKAVETAASNAVPLSR